jgi:hypothetical protein
MGRGEVVCSDVNNAVRVADPFDHEFMGGHILFIVEYSVCIFYLVRIIPFCYSVEFLFYISMCLLMMMSSIHDFLLFIFRRKNVPFLAKYNSATLAILSVPATLVVSGMSNLARRLWRLCRFVDSVDVEPRQSLYKVDV